MTYDSEVLEVWLDELTPEPEPVHEVCDFHAGRLTAPRGWKVSDRRAPRPSDELLPSGRPSSTVASVPPAALAAEPQAAHLGPGSEPAPVADDVPTSAPGSDQDAPTGSLLARAFRSTGRRSDAPAEDRP